jgi:iron complex outermembrane receptor protein
MKKSPLALAVLVATSGVSGLMAGAVQAQQTPQKSFELEEVVVTARRTEESMQDVPVAVSSFSTQDMAAFNITQTEDIAAFTPGMFTEPPAANNLSGVKTTIRGQVQSDTLSTLDPSVGWYVDDVYLARVTGTAGSLFDLDRVEVLKGPQGTLYGRNTTGGAVKVITTKADPSADLNGYVTGSTGDFGLAKAGGAVNLPILNDVLAVRLTALSDNLNDGYGSVNVNANPAGFLYPDNKWVNPKLGKVDAGERKSTLYRVGTTWKATDKLDVNMMYEYSDYYANAILMGLVDAPAVGYTRPKDIYDGAQVNHLQEAWSTSKIYSLTLDYALTDNLSTKFVYGFRDLNSRFMSDIDGTPQPINYFIKPFVQNDQQNSYEWQLAGSSFDNKLDWLAGLYYFEESGKDFSTSNGATELRGTPTIIAGSYNGTIDQNESSSVFGNAIYHLTDTLSLSAGLRYTEDKKPVSVNAERFLLGGASECRFDVNTVPNVNVDNCTWENSKDYNYTSWSASVDWNFVENVMAYVKSAKGFRSGGQNLRGLGDATVEDGAGNISTINTNTPFDTESATDVELGLKGQFFDNSLQVNAAAYHIWYDDLQRSLLLSTSKGLTTFVENTSKAEYDGLELEATWVVTESFMLSGTANWFDYNFDDNADYAGGTPDQEYTFRANYLIPVSNGTVVMDANYSYRGQFLPNASASKQDLQNTPGFEVDSVSLVGARLAFEMDNGLTMAAWGKNLTDEEYTLSGLVLSTSVGLNAGGVGVPRSYGLDLTYNF